MSGPATPASLKSIPCHYCGSIKSIRWMQGGIVYCLVNAKCAANIPLSPLGRPFIDTAENVDAGLALANDECFCVTPTVATNEYGETWCSVCGERLLLDA